jgi:hypothetical protein
VLGHSCVDPLVSQLRTPSTCTQSTSDTAQWRL